VRGDHFSLPDDIPGSGSGCCRSTESRSPAVKVAAWAAIPAAFSSLLLSPVAAEFPLGHLRHLLDRLEIKDPGRPMVDQIRRLIPNPIHRTTAYRRSG